MLFWATDPPMQGVGEFFNQKYGPTQNAYKDQMCCTVYFFQKNCIVAFDVLSMFFFLRSNRIVGGSIDTTKFYEMYVVYIRWDIGDISETTNKRTPVRRHVSLQICVKWTAYIVFKLLEIMAMFDRRRENKQTFDESRTLNVTIRDSSNIDGHIVSIIY